MRQQNNVFERQQVHEAELCGPCCSENADCRPRGNRIEENRDTPNLWDHQHGKLLRSKEYGLKPDAYGEEEGRRLSLNPDADRLPRKWPDVDGYDEFLLPVHD